MENIRITLETLYDILRNEKKKADLQKLDQSFFVDIVSYLKEKRIVLSLKNEGDELFASGEKDKVEYELRSIKRILKELYEKREKKILDIAINKSRTGSDIINTSAMLREEKEFYKQVLKTLDLYRRGVLLNLFRGELPLVLIEEGSLVSPGASIIAVKKKKEQIKVELEKNTSEKFAPELEELAEESELENLAEDSIRNSPGNSPGNSTMGLTRNSIQVLPTDLKEKFISKQEEKEQEEQAPEMVPIKFIHPTPSFVWKNMKVYGPYDKGEETDMFLEVANLLVRKGRAEKI